MVKLNLKYYKGLTEVFKRLNILRRWTFFTIEGRYNELAKQALNCMVAFILASYCEEAGETVRWDRFPKIAIYRAFQKAYVYFDTPEHILKDIAKVGNISKDAFDKATEEIMEEETDQEFVDFISEGINTYEMEIYKAATKVATLIELRENQSRIGTLSEYNKKMTEILNDLKKFSDLPGIEELKDTEGEVFQVFRKISSLRNQNRWAVMCYTLDSSVLGHLFDTAVYAYLCGLEKYQNEKIATDMFWTGIFHDVPETWTKDIPSPIKKYISGFREAIKQYEEKMLEMHLYAKVPDFIAERIKKVLRLEESEELRKIFKGADYLSADSECWRFYKGGSRDEYFLETAIKNFQEDLDSQKYELPPIAYKLHRYFYDYASSLKLKI